MNKPESQLGLRFFVSESLKNLKTYKFYAGAISIALLAILLLARAQEGKIEPPHILIAFIAIIAGGILVGTIESAWRNRGKINQHNQIIVIIWAWFVSLVSMIIIIIVLLAFAFSWPPIVAENIFGKKPSINSIVTDGLNVDPPMGTAADINIDQKEITMLCRLVGDLDKRYETWVASGDNKSASAGERIRDEALAVADKLKNRKGSPTIRRSQVLSSFHHEMWARTIAISTLVMDPPPQTDTADELTKYSDLMENMLRIHKDLVDEYKFKYPNAYEWATDRMSDTSGHLDQVEFWGVYAKVVRDLATRSNETHAQALKAVNDQKARVERYKLSPDLLMERNAVGKKWVEDRNMKPKGQPGV